jgi:CheY-like chemotaxis protein
MSNSLRVLLVDDHDDMLTIMQLLMTQRGYSVATATSGAEALALAPEFAPQVVVSDIGMPGMDGYELMSTLRRADELAPFKSIALTGYDEPDDHERARQVGYDAQMTKPVDFNSLFNVIDDLAKKIEPK